MVSEHQRLRIEKALLYIEKTLDRPLSVDVIASEASLSVHHFQRLFREVMGESVLQYRINRRLERAAAQLLASPELTILDVALHWGFDSHTSFSKAFKKHFSITPKNFKVFPHNANDLGDRSRPFLNQHKAKFNQTDVSLIQLPKLYLNYKVDDGNVNGTFFDDALGTIRQEFASLIHEARPSFLGICSAFPSSPKNLNDPNALIHFGALYCEKHRSDWSNKWVEIPEGLWAQFVHKDAYEFLYQNWSLFYHNWLPLSGYKQRSAWPIELYFSEGSGLFSQVSGTPLLIPVQRAQMEQSE